MGRFREESSRSSISCKKSKQEERSLEQVARSKRLDKHARCMGSRKREKGEGKALCKARQGKGRGDRVE